MFRFLILVSGLELATNIATHFQVQLFVDWIYGLLGDEMENIKVSKIVQVLIAGNFFNLNLLRHWLPLYIHFKNFYNRE